MDTNLTKSEKNRVLKAGLLSGIVAFLLSGGAVYTTAITNCIPDAQSIGPLPGMNCMTTFTAQSAFILLVVMALAGLAGTFLVKQMKGWKYVIVGAILASIISYIGTWITAVFATNLTTMVTAGFVGYLIGFAIASKVVKR